MPLLDVIGVSSFNTSFYSCFGFLSKEEEEDYIWALTMFKKVLGTNEPAVIVSDRELALMNAIRVVFPRTTNLLCSWHVEKNISANCKKYFEDGSDWDTFIICWTGVIQSDSQSLFNEAWKELEGAYEDKVNVINYVRKTWLPFRHHFVKAWTDLHLHFGNRVSSRAEGAHAKLKDYLQLSTNNLLLASERICLAVDSTFREIKAQLAREKIRIPHSLCCPFFKEVAYRVSVFALDKLFQQYKLASSPSPLQPCKGHFTSTMGLPCSHMIRNMSNRVLHLSDIHIQWRIDVRSFEDGRLLPNNENDKFKLLLQDLGNKYLEWPVTRKEAAEKHVTQMVNSPMPILFDPATQPHRGRPPKSKKKRGSTSTRRDESAFEIAENTRKCSRCSGVGHNIRTCPDRGTPESATMTNSVESTLHLDSLDLNSFPNIFSHGTKHLILCSASDNLPRASNQNYFSKATQVS